MYEVLVFMCLDFFDVLEEKKNVIASLSHDRLDRYVCRAAIAITTQAHRVPIYPRAHSFHTTSEIYFLASLIPNEPARTTFILAVHAARIFHRWRRVVFPQIRGWCAVDFQSATPRFCVRRLESGILLGSEQRFVCSFSHSSNFE